MKDSGGFLSPVLGNHTVVSHLEYLQIIITSITNILTQ